MDARDMRRREVGSQLREGQAVVKEWCERCGAANHVGVIASFDGPRAGVAMLCRQGEVRLIGRHMLRPFRGEARGLKTLAKILRLRRLGRGTRAGQLQAKLTRLLKGSP